MLNLTASMSNKLWSKEMAQPPHTTEEKYLNQIRELVLRETSTLDCSIVLFGSRARGEHRRSSDIDIAFGGLNEHVFTRVRDRLLAEIEESIIPHHVDLVNMDNAPADFRKVAMKEVITWKQSSREN
jgi:predicted nucleotidyltransferase